MPALAEGKQILLKAQAAAGGAEKLAAVKDYTMLAEYLIDPACGEHRRRKDRPDRQMDRAHASFRQDATLPAGRVTAYTDGKIGWISTPQGWGALTGAQRSQVFGDLFRVYYRLLLSDRLEGRTVNAIDGNSVQITDTTGQVASVEFDPQTHLAETRVVRHAAGGRRADLLGRRVRGFSRCRRHQGSLQDHDQSGRPQVRRRRGERL